jgi:hypothetical protein
LELLDETNIDVQHTLGIHPIHNLFCQYPVCNVYRLWQPDVFHQLLLGSVKDTLHQLLKYLKDRNVKDQFDTQFTSVPHFPGLELFTKQFDSRTSSSCQGEGSRGRIRTLVVNCASILDCSQDTGKTAVKIPPEEIVMGAVWAFCEFPLLVSEQNHYDLSLPAVDDARKQF